MVRFTLHLILAILPSIGAVAQSTAKVVQPKGNFDIRAATEMLNEGNSTIRGIAFFEGRTLTGIQSEATVYAAAGSVITVYPVTPYLEEYLQLKQQNKPNKQIAAIHALAASFRIETKVISDRGEFIITGLKPGKYYLQGDISFPSGIGVKEVSNIVDITINGETVRCTLKKIYRGFIY